MSSIAGRLESLSEYRLREEDLLRERSIGGGAFGEVFVGSWTGSKRRAAIKVLRRRDGDEEVFCRELEALAHVRHRNIVPFFGFTDGGESRQIVTQYIPNDSLFKALREDPKGLRLTPDDLQSIAIGIAKAVEFMHSKSLIHRDLKTENILIDEEKQPMICDFGSSRSEGGGAPIVTGDCGTLNYMAPEFLDADASKEKGYDHKVDVYSLGMIFWEMLTGKMPYEGDGQIKVILAVAQGQRPKIPTETPRELGNLIERMWDASPDERPPLDEIVMLLLSDALFPGASVVEKPEKNERKPVKQRTESVLRKDRKDKKKATVTPRKRSEVHYGSVPRRKRGSDELRGGATMNAFLAAVVDPLELSVNKLGDGVDIRLSIEVIEKNVEGEALRNLPFWPAVLKQLRLAKGEDLIAVKALSVKLGRLRDKLECLDTVTNLHDFVCENSFDVFLYVVCHLERLITIDLTRAIAVLVDDTGPQDVTHRAVVLLYKIWERLEPDNYCRMFIIDLFAKYICDFTNRQCGEIMLYVLSACGALNQELLGLFFESQLQDNVASAYPLLRQNNISPNANKVANLIEHINADHVRLREGALEFVRLYTYNLDDETILLQLIDSLIASYLRFPSDNPVVLLCRMASDEQQMRMLMVPDVIDIWMNASETKAAGLMRVFYILFKNERVRRELLLLPQVPGFFKCILMGDDDDAVLAVCYVIHTTVAERVFIVELNEHGTTDALVTRFMRLNDDNLLYWAMRAMRATARYTYCPGFGRAIPRLLQLIKTRHPNSVMCLDILSIFSNNAQSRPAFQNSANVLDCLGEALLSHGDAARYANEVLKHLGITQGM